MSFFFFFNDTATTEIYTLSLHDALPISLLCKSCHFFIAHFFVHNQQKQQAIFFRERVESFLDALAQRSEEHTSELQSRSDIVCRLLLENNKRDPAQHLRVKLQSMLSRQH